MRPPNRLDVLLCCLVVAFLATCGVLAAPPARQFEPSPGTIDDKQDAQLQRVSSRTNDLGEQVDGVGLALVETEDQLRDEIRKLRDELAALRSEMEGIRDDHAKLWILMHSPPVADGANPVKEFMEAKRPEIYAYSPWFACPHCVTAKAWFEKNKAPFDIHWQEIDSLEEARGMRVPDEAKFPLYQMTDKSGKWWFIWSKTPEQVIAEFKARNN